MSDLAPRNGAVLEIDNLVVGLGKATDGHRVIDNISLQVRERETLCLVGESGSGKSVTSLTVMGLLPKRALVPTGGGIRLAGEEISPPAAAGCGSCAPPPWR